MQIFSSSYKSQAKMSRKIRCSVDIVRSGNLVQVRGCGIARNQETGSLGMRRQVFNLALENFLVLVCIVWNCWRTCLLKTYLMFVVQLFVWCLRLCAFYIQYYSFLPFCHEHQFGLNSRIAAPKFCTKSRFYFLRRNLFEQFAPTLPKSKIA